MGSPNPTHDLVTTCPGHLSLNSGSRFLYMQCMYTVTLNQIHTKLDRGREENLKTKKRECEERPLFPTTMSRKTSQKAQRGEPLDKRITKAKSGSTFLSR